MKNIKAIGFLILAIFAGIGAAIFAAGWAAQKSQAGTTRVVVAVTDIDMGSKITPAMLTVVNWPSGSVPQGAFSKVDGLQERVIKVNLQKGEALIERKLTPQGAQSGLSAVISEGKRAMTVRVNDVVGVAGFALPGTYVDVMLNTQSDQDGIRRNRDQDKRISKTVLERVLVLAVAQESSRDDAKPKVVKAVTLELSIHDAEKLDLARSVGTLSLMLRNQFDQQAVKTAGMTRRELLGLPEVVEAKVIKAGKPVMQVARKPAATPKLTNCVDVFVNGSMHLQCFE